MNHPRSQYQTDCTTPTHSTVRAAALGTPQTRARSLCSAAAWALRALCLVDDAELCRPCTASTLLHRKQRPVRLYNCPRRGLRVWHGRMLTVGLNLSMSELVSVIKDTALTTSNAPTRIPSHPSLVITPTPCAYEYGRVRSAAAPHLLGTEI